MSDNEDDWGDLNTARKDDSRNLEDLLDAAESNVVVIGK